MRYDIDMYVNTRYMGFFPLERIGLFFGEYFERAHKASEFIDWDEVILYAILAYDSDTQSLVSADFMILRMDYPCYVKLADKLSENCRLFIIRNT